MQDKQRLHWDESFSRDTEFFGPGPSYPARQALRRLEREGVKCVLELGAGQGRDSLYFARHCLKVICLDYSQQAIEEIRSKARAQDLEHKIEAITHDLRLPLPFADESIESCYSHMLYCMDFTTGQVMSLSKEIRRVLKPGGLNIFTVRHTGDAHYGKGISHGDNRFESDGFIVHFFDRSQIERLAEGFDLISINEFEEGELPRKLFLVILKKNS
jgi:SAM-dependent methyltransferase